MAQKTTSLLRASCIAAISTALLTSHVSAQNLPMPQTNLTEQLGEYQLAQTIIVVEDDGTTKKKKKKRKRRNIVSDEGLGDSGEPDGSHGGSFKM